MNQRTKKLIEQELAEEEEQSHRAISENLLSNVGSCENFTPSSSCDVGTLLIYLAKSDIPQEVLGRIVKAVWEFEKDKS